MTKQISPERKKLYNAGLVLIIIGLCLFALPFLAIPIAMTATFAGGVPTSFPTGILAVPVAFVASFIGFALIVGGGAMRVVAARGKAGSGLVLDPEQAREDLKLWTGMAGGIVKDVLNEADINIGGDKTDKVVMIRCQSCQKVNEEDSKFCQECGKPL
ncbi:MAG: zinc-ribbon domain-containing protein [Planctomycetaceae bacterium]|nr:zinc-ribbon domain-containing protein [Planctomycetaceae bacterium]